MSKIYNHLTAEIVEYLENQNLFFHCPHCGGGIVVETQFVNCGIFRHAVWKQTIQNNPSQVKSKIIDPHTSKAECEKLVQSGKIEGCAKPFELIWVIEAGIYIVRKCDYK